MMKEYSAKNVTEALAVAARDKGVTESELVYEVLEEKDSIKPLSIKYKKNIKKNYKLNSRIEIEKIKFLENYFNNLNKIEDEYLLKYIYYYIYNLEENNINKVYENLKELINEDLNTIYNSVKKINIELKNNL